MARPLSQRDRGWLTAEMEHWQSQGLVSAEQSAGILACYETPAELTQRKRSLASFALASLAALMVGLAMLALVGYNWQAIEAGWGALSRFAKVGVVLFIVGATHFSAVWLRARTNHRRAAELLLFLGGLFYGAGIWLVAQAFHLDAHYPDGVWWWAVGVLLVALCAESLLLHCLFAGLLALWAGMETMNFAHIWWLDFVPNGAYSLVPLAAIGLVWCYRRSSVWGVAIYTSLLAWWLVLLGIAMNSEHSAVYFLAMTGPLMLILAEAHPRGSLMARPYRIVGVLLTAGALIPTSFHDFHNHVRYASLYRHQDLAAFVPGAVLVAMLAIGIAFSVLVRKPKRELQTGPLDRLRDLFEDQWVTLTLALGAVAMAFVNNIFGADAAVQLTIAGNVLMLLLAVWMMAVGVREEVGALFAGGVLYFLLWTILRYVDLFSNVAGLLGAALMFLFCGAVLFGLSVVWRKRKELRRAL